MRLFPHQRKALEETQNFNRVAYYLDMGLGKTYIGGEKAKQLDKPLLVICQKSKVEDWVQHLVDVAGYDTFDLTNKKELEFFSEVMNGDPETANKTAGVINYDLVFRRSYFANISGFTLLLDESSIIQNETAKRSKFILKMQPENVILLSGTPTAGNCGRSFVCLGGLSQKTSIINSMLKWNGLKITTADSEFPVLQVTKMLTV